MGSKRLISLLGRRQSSKKAVKCVLNFFSTKWRLFSLTPPLGDVLGFRSHVLLIDELRSECCSIKKQICFFW